MDVDEYVHPGWYGCNCVAQLYHLSFGGTKALNSYGNNNDLRIKKTYLLQNKTVPVWVEAAQQFLSFWDVQKGIIISSHVIVTINSVFFVSAKRDIQL